jgi:SAM-dependent methyltransferase
VNARSASFRDPDGTVFFSDGRVFRATTGVAAATLGAVLETAAGQQLVASGRLVTTTVVPPETARQVAPEGYVEAQSELLEHERIPFPSYPYEWSAEMLHAAAALTIDIARELLPCGFGLKDATPYNVLFRGPRPVFVDVLSFESRDPRDPIWIANAQFARTFLLPLAANKYIGAALDQIFVVHRDGLEPEEVYRWLPVTRRLRPPFLSLATLPAMLARRRGPNNARLYQPHTVRDPEKARFILQSSLRTLSRMLDRLEPRAAKSSKWSGYAETNHYPAAAAEGKTAFVERALREFRPRRVLDVGANTGRFSELAAAHGASVVAIDSDPVVVGELWRSARAKGSDILPLVVDITRPSPPTGWRNRECASFLDRCRGSFDCVMMLAILHHVLITERIPLAEAIDLAAELTTDLVIVEWVGQRDPMFQALLRGRHALYEQINEANFQAALVRRFELVWREPLEKTERTLYVLRKRAAVS